MKNYHNSIVISFMGVDGSGKSTLIKKIINKFKKKFKKIKYLHLKPYFLLIDKSTFNKSPHNFKKLRSNFSSLIVILIWLFQYKIFFFINRRKKNQLIIFDRYAHDLLIDRVRYRHSLSLTLTKKILKLFPEPHLWVFLHASPKVIETRKKELSRKELNRQIREYIKFSKTKKNSILLKTNNNNPNNLLLIKKKIETIISI
jgi:thymidylate kinase